MRHRCSFELLGTTLQERGKVTKIWNLAQKPSRNRVAFLSFFSFIPPRIGIRITSLLLSVLTSVIGGANGNRHAQLKVFKVRIRQLVCCGGGSPSNSVDGRVDNVSMRIRRGVGKRSVGEGNAPASHSSRLDGGYVKRNRNGDRARRSTIATVGFV